MPTSRGTSCGLVLFETTAFVTAVLVGLFSFIPDPTGRQDARDAAEIRVYAHWRRAIVLIGLDLLLKAAVVVVQASQRRSAKTVFWTLALMAAPWAPFLDKAVTAIRAWSDVRALMLSRVARNEISCVMREYLKMGHQGLTSAAMVEEVTTTIYSMPEEKLKAVVLRNDHAMAHNREYRERVENLQEVQGEGAAWGVTHRARRHGPQPQNYSSHQRRLWWRRLDIWTRRWTQSRFTPAGDPFPPGPLARPMAAVAGQPLGASSHPGAAPVGATRAPPANGGAAQRSATLVHTLREYILDAIDCHDDGGHTLSQLRSLKSLPSTLCPRCMLAFRGAVDTFLESSSRAHTDVHAGDWLDATNIEWRGRMEIVVDAMWEAAFVDHTGLSVEDEQPCGRHDGAPTASTRHATATSRKFLVFLFLLARSSLGACLVLEEVGQRIKTRLHSRGWWQEY